jgi:aminopeptidase N
MLPTRMLYRPLLLTGLVLAGMCCPAAARQAEAPAAQAVPTFDEATGRDLLNYPRSPVVNYVHMRLEVDIPDMNVPRAAAVQTLTFLPIAGPVAHLDLDARLLTIVNVVLERVETVTGGQTKESRGVPTRLKAPAYEYDNAKLRLTFDPPLEPGTLYNIVTSYRIDDPPQGLVWTPESPAWPGRAAQLYTQGESEFNSYWFPCHDFPNARLTTELIVTVPAGYLVSSNGRLVEQGKGVAAGTNAVGQGTLQGRERFHWVQDQPHVNYLVTLVVGKFDVVDVAPPGQLPAGFPERVKGAYAGPYMPVYVPPGQGDRVPGTFGRTPRMIELFSRLFDEPYAWDRYAQLSVWNFDWGGMENTSATTLFDAVAVAKDEQADYDQDDLISHELAHQWFGDLVTCRSWEHIWLNEGFATYCENLWFEHRDGPDAYLAGVRRNFDDLIAGDRADAPYQAAMVSKAWDRPDDVFNRPSNPYSKGSAILHMLRTQLGDEVFLACLRTYIDRFRLGTPETNDLRKVMEEVSGESLERFFAQWCMRPGVPAVDVDAAWDADAHALNLKVTQTQHIDGYNPAFSFRLPVRIEAGGTVIRKVIDVDSKETAASIPLPSAPTMVAVDPALAVLADLKVHEPAAWWTNQLLRGPTVAARIQAARGLASDDSMDASMALWATVMDSRLHEALRIAAIDSLKMRPQRSWVMDLAVAQIQDSRVREAAVSAIAHVAASDAQLVEDAKIYFAQRVRHDPSKRVRAASLAALGRLKAVEHADLMVQACGEESQFDRVRQRALEALADADVPAGLTVAARLAEPGTNHRTRPIAITTVRRLAHHNPDAAYSAIARQLFDRERPVREAAAHALVELGDARGVAELHKLASTLRDPVDQREAAEWAKALRDKTGAP